MSSVNIIESNPFIFVNRVIDAIKDGFYVEMSNEGWVVDTQLKEITMFKDRKREFEPFPYGEVTIVEYNTQEFLSKIQNAVMGGVTISLDTLYWDSPKIIKGEKRAPANYNREQLENMEWEAFKEELKTVGITGRNRLSMVNLYLKYTGQDYQD